MGSRKRDHLRNLALCSRPAANPSGELNPAMVEAVKLDPSLEARFAAQSRIDAAAAATVSALPCDDAFLERVAGDTRKVARKRTNWRALCGQPAFFAVLFAVVALGGVFTFLLVSEMDHYSGADALIQLTGDIQRLDGSEFEVTEAEIGTLADWFFLNHGLEGFHPPAELAGEKAMGARVASLEGAPVGQAVFGEDGHILSIFRSEDLAMDAPHTWKRLPTPDSDGWEVAVKQAGALCYLVAVHGDRDDLTRVIDRLNR